MKRWAKLILLFVAGFLLAALAGSCLLSGMLGCADTEVQGDTAAQRTLLYQQAAKAAAEDGPLTLVAALAEHGVYLLPAKQIRGYWTRPTTGSPVVYYRLLVDYRLTHLATDTTLTFKVPADADSLAAMVDGVDAAGRIGDPSPWSGYHILEQ